MFNVIIPKNYKLNRSIKLSYKGWKELYIISLELYNLIDSNFWNIKDKIVITISLCFHLKSVFRNYLYCFIKYKVFWYRQNAQLWCSLIIHNYWFFQYFDIAPRKAIALNLFCFILDTISVLLSLISLSVVIALPTIAIAIFVALSQGNSDFDGTNNYFADCRYLYYYRSIKGN